MKLSFAQLSKVLTPAVVALDAVFFPTPFTFRIVGGTVRDLLISDTPNDIDLATDATPDQMMEIFDAAGVRYEPTGLQHGTLTVILHGETIEITTLRIDVETDGRHAEVEFTTDWMKDAERRDLTFNAMNMDLDGNVYDYFDGIKHLAYPRKAVFVGNADTRVKEDYLRILRYYRFYGRLACSNFDDASRAAVADNVDGLDQVSGERIWSELKKILVLLNRDRILRKMVMDGVFGNLNLSAKHLDKLDELTYFDYHIAMAFLVENVTHLRLINERFKMSREEFDLIEFLVDRRDRGHTMPDYKRLLTNPKVDNRWVWLLMETHNKVKECAELKTWMVPTFPVTGQDLIARGDKPGRTMGLTLATMRFEWELSDYTLTRDELLNMVTE